MILLENNTGFLYQWEKGKRLIIHDVTINSVGYSLNKSTSLVMKPCYMDGSNKVADIPPSLLKEPGILNVYGCYVDANKDDVKIHRQYRIIARNKPSDYVEPKEEPRWLDHEKRITDLELYGGNGGTGGSINIKQVEKIVNETVNEALKDVDNEYSPKEHTHSDYATTTQLNELSDEIVDHEDDTTKHITSAERTAWNNKSSFSGSYNDLTNKPNIPSKTSQLTNDSDYVNKTYVDEKVANFESEAIPSYWVSELETKANAIQVAMEKAGRNKSAFLWYTDAHWKNGNAKVSPLVLNYLYMNTPMNKVNFGGDIIGDSLLATREEMKYLYEWRKAIKDLPNHHSVFGNHDMFDSDSVDYENDNYRYAFLLAPEETSDMVMGNGNYYYIDNHAEKTRYLYLAYLVGNHSAMTGQGEFIVNALKSVEDGWHIVAIAHRWWQYSSSKTPTVGSIPAYESEILDVFDKYNARATRSGSNYFTAQDFSSAKGKVEFCIGGHIHVDYDIFSNGGIPIIITTADANQDRVADTTVDSGTVGTSTEQAVFGIIADYNEDVTKITVVGVGRGTSRVVRASSVTPQSISNITYNGDTTIESAIDKAKFSFTVNYSDGSTSSVSGASSVTPTTIATVGNNTVTITYIENGITLSGTATIVGTAKPIVNLLKLNRTYVAGTSGENILNNLDDTKAYTNVGYGDGVFREKACTVTDITENSITVTEPGVGGTTVAYYVDLPNLKTKSYKLSFDYEGVNSKKARVYFRGIYTENNTLAGTNGVVDSAGSGHIDYEIAPIGGCEKGIIFIGSNTSGTAKYTNVSLTEV